MQAAHSTAITIGGDEYWVRRSFDLIKRIEQAFGPLDAIDKRLRARGYIGTDLVKLYRIAIEECPDRPGQPEIEEHVYQAGVVACCMDLAVLVLQLFSGHKQCVAWLEAEMKSASGVAREFEAQNPPMPS
jgi:hypothetical protein